MLERLRSLPQPIRVSIIGMGAMGRGLLHQCRITPGMRVVAVADIDLKKAVRCVKEAGLSGRVVESVAQGRDAIGRGRVAICVDEELAAAIEQADVLIESTSAIAAGGRYALAAIEHGKHLVLMNAEVDLTFGPALLREARRRGVTYTSCDGDQHGVIKRLVDEVRLWGFELVMAGNIKGFLDRRANPTSIVPEADKRGLDYRMCAAYTDGTKLNIEMALLANALDLRADRAGMHGPAAGHVREALGLFDLEGMRGRGRGQGQGQGQGRAAVDYVLGAQPDGGVFVIGYNDDKYQKRMMRYYKMGDGPFYVFHRPYHLCHVEAMRCVAEAALDGVSCLRPEAGMRTNVFAYAKRGLRGGEKLDGPGGHTCYGLIENCPEDGRAAGLPICLADGLTLKRDIERDAAVLMSDVAVAPGRFDFELYAQAVRASGSKAVSAAGAP